MSSQRNAERSNRLSMLTPLDAVGTWLDGEFGFGDEAALIVAIRRDPRVRISDDKIIDTMCDAIDEELNATACLERLAQNR